MSKKKGVTLPGIDKQKADSMATQVKELRLFFNGWEAAGGKLPVGHEVLWQLHMALRNAK